MNENSPAPDSSRPVAAIDLGTHTVLLLVCRGALGDGDDPIEVLHDELAFARLGEGLAGTGRLSAAAVSRTLDTLSGFLERARSLGVVEDDVRAVGTAVLRRAEDAPDFVARCRSELGLEVEVLAGEEEARLGHLAVAEPGADTVTIDAGGASTEVASASGGQRVSIPVGALLLTERYLGYGGAAPACSGGWGALRAEVDQASRALPTGLGAGCDVVLLGGAATNLACLELGLDGLETFDHIRAEGRRVSAEAANRWAERLVKLDLDARRGLPIEPERAQVLPAGLVCIAAALVRIGASDARATRRGLRYGVARELLERRGPSR